MMNEINIINMWFNSNKKVISNFKSTIDSLDLNSIKRESFMKDEYLALNSLFNNVLSSYMKTVESYIRLDLNDFSFSDYDNMNAFLNETDNVKIKNFLTWIKNKHLKLIEDLNSEIKSNNITLDSLYEVSKYHLYMIEHSLKDNRDSAFNFIMSFIKNTMKESILLSRKRKQNNINQDNQDYKLQTNPSLFCYDFTNETEFHNLSKDLIGSVRRQTLYITNY